MERIYAVEGSRISLGRRDENLARCILFDISRWEDSHFPRGFICAHLSAQPFPSVCCHIREPLIY